MVKRIDLYSILVSNEFKLPPNNDNQMFLRGYTFYFLKNVLDADNDTWMKIGSYTDAEWAKLFYRLKKNGHTLV